MFAIVDIAGFQEKVEEGQKLRVPHLPEDAGKKIILKSVLLLANGEHVTVGAPYVPNATVEAEVTTHGRGDKIRVVKAHRRKRYRRVHGHRQEYTEVKVLKIQVG